MIQNKPYAPTWGEKRCPCRRVCTTFKRQGANCTIWCPTAEGTLYPFREKLRLSLRQEALGCTWISDPAFYPIGEWTAEVQAILTIGFSWPPSPPIQFTLFPIIDYRRGLDGHHFDTSQTIDLPISQMPCEDQPDYDAMPDDPGGPFFPAGGSWGGPVFARWLAFDET